MKRFGHIIRVKPGKIEEYKKLHEKVWPEVLDMIKACHIRNYTIFLHDGLLFSTFEYTGVDYVKDMEKMAADPKTREWWALTAPCQSPVESARKDEWWTPMEEVFHTD